MIIRSVAPGTHHESLTAAVLRYQRTGEGFSQILERIGPIVYLYPKQIRSTSEDDCGDFFCFFFPKIHNILHRFSYHGTCFENYLAISIKWQFKTYVTRKAKQDLAGRTILGPGFWPSVDEQQDPFLVHEKPSVPPEARSVLSINDAGVITDPVISKRIVLLVLKASQEIAEDTVCGLAKLAGVEPEWLAQRIHALHARLEDRRKRRTLLRRRRDQAYFRIHYFQEKLRIETNEDSRYEINRLIRAERTHLQNARYDLARVPVSPSHSDIASVLEIPKGSVDSALYYARNTLTDANSRHTNTHRNN